MDYKYLDMPQLDLEKFKLMLKTIKIVLSLVLEEIRLKISVAELMIGNLSMGDLNVENYWKGTHIHVQVYSVLS